MTIHVPQWVRDACKLWGRQKRRIWSGSDWYYTSTGEKRRHIDGYAESFLGRVQDERVAAGSGGSIGDRQRWPEVFSGEGLEVQRASFGMDETNYRALHLHYVWDPEFKVTSTQKAAWIGISRANFWTALALGETWVWSRLEPQERLDAEYRRQSLSFEPKKSISRATIPQAALSLKSLNRPVLSRRR